MRDPVCLSQNSSLLLVLSFPNIVRVGYLDGVVKTSRSPDGNPSDIYSSYI
jgi:hypothetical protein